MTEKGFTVTGSCLSHRTVLQFIGLCPGFSLHAYVFLSGALCAVVRHGRQKACCARCSGLCVRLEARFDVGLSSAPGIQGWRQFPVSMVGCDHCNSTGGQGCGVHVPVREQ